MFEHYFNLCSIFVPEFLLIHLNRIFVTSFVDGMVSLCLHLVSCLSTWDGIFKFHIHIAMFTQIDSCEPAPNPGSLGLPRESCYTRTVIVLFPFMLLTYLLSLPYLILTSSFPSHPYSHAFCPSSFYL